MTTEAYQLARWFVEEIRGEGWYYPKHVREISSAKSMLAGGKDPAGDEIPPFTLEQIRTVVTALTKGCHLTDWRPFRESEHKWMGDSNGIKGLWVIRRFIHDFFCDPPPCPPYWEQPRYDDWVALFGPAAYQMGDFMIYAGWSQQGPEKSGLHPDKLSEWFGEKFVNLSLKVWRVIYDPERQRSHPSPPTDRSDD